MSERVRDALIGVDDFRLRVHRDDAWDSAGSRNALKADICSGVSRIFLMFYLFMVVETSRCVHLSQVNALLTLHGINNTCEVYSLKRSKWLRSCAD